MRRRLAAAVLAAVLGGGLAACAPAPDLSDSAAAGLQASVQLVAGKAAAGDPGAAVAELDALQAKLDAAVDGGDVVDERSAEIQAKIDAVRADLQQQIADAEAAAAAAAAAQAAAEAAAAETQRVAAEQAEAQRLADEAAARENAKPDKGPKNDDKPGKP